MQGEKKEEEKKEKTNMLQLHTPTPSLLPLRLPKPGARHDVVITTYWDLLGKPGPTGQITKPLAPSLQHSNVKKK